MNHENHYLRPHGHTATRPHGHTATRPQSKRLIISNLIKLTLLSFCFIYTIVPYNLLAQGEHSEGESYIPYSDFGSSENYDFNLESALQPNYMFRWPIPLVPGEFTVKVRVHYVNAQGSSIPNQLISSAKSFAQSIFGEHEINIQFQPDRIYQPQDWTPSFYPNSIGVLHDGFFTTNPPNTTFEQDEIHIVIFDKNYVHHLTDWKTPFSIISNTQWTPWVNIYWKRIPHRTAAVGWPNPNSPNKLGDYNEEKIIHVSIAAALGTTFGIMPFTTGDPIGTSYANSHPHEESDNCHITGDFLCDTRPTPNIIATNFNQTGCGFTAPTLGLARHENNVMAYYTTAYQCIDHITEEQARKIRYVFANDEELHTCLTSNSTLEFDNFMITPIRTVITQNTVWEKPAALHILEIEEGAEFTTHASIDFAPGDYIDSIEVASWGFSVIRIGDYSNGYTKEIDWNYKSVSDAFARVSLSSRMNVYGGSLNNYYSYLPWSGIIAVGDRSQPQSGIQMTQAVIHFQDAKIQMAHEAIYPLDRVRIGYYYDGQGITNTTGSYVLAFDTDFINCRRVIGFRDYANMRNIGGTQRELNNLSHFTRCNIIQDDRYRFSNVPLGITLNRVMGVRILGCNFENRMSHRGSIESLTNYRGDAVFAQSASFFMDRYCPSTFCSNSTPSSITGYDRGVFIQRNHPSLSITYVKNTEFNYNFYSAYIEANNFFEFEDNVVNLPPGVPLFDENRPFSTYGLYVKSSINFSVEGNLFQMAGNAPTYMPIDLNGFPVGMVVNSTYTDEDAAYRNTFEGLELGILGLGQNRLDEWDGLQIRCNIFNDCSHDILVPIPDLYPENSVSHFQGYAQVGWTPQDLANNLFSHTNNDPNIISDFDNNGPYWLHYFRPLHPSQPRFEPRGNHIFRLHDGPQFDPTNWEDRCPEGLLVIKMDTTLVPSSLQRVVLDSLKNDYLSDVEVLSQLIDQGNTPQLLADIFSYPESEYYYMFLDLMAQSPYLSEGVLIEVINLSNFPDVLLRNLLMENPQSISSENILTAIIERTPALPQYMIDDIINGTDFFGPKEALESRIAHKNAKFKRFGAAVLKALTSEMAKDDEQAWLTDSLLSVLDAINTPHTMLMKAAFLQNYGMSGYELAYQAAISLLNGSDSLIQGEFEGFAEIMELSLSIEDSLSTNDIQTLEAWRYSNYPAAQSLAYSLLLEYGVATDSMLIDPLVTPASMLKTQRNRPNTQLSVNPNRMKLYPNPARDYTVLHYELKGVERTLNYRIMDLSGRTVLHGSFKAKVTGDEIITLPNVANGAYIILVEEVNGEPLESIKLNIFR